MSPAHKRTANNCASYNMTAQHTMIQHSTEYTMHTTAKQRNAHNSTALHLT